MEDEKRKDLNESELNASSQTEKGESKENKNGKKPPIKLIAIVAVVAVVAVVSVAAIALLAGGEVAHTHEFSEWTTTKSATCTEDGVRERFCDCGETQSQVIAKTGHEYGEFTVVEEPTCVKEGLRESKCNNCDAKRTESIAVVDHKYGEWQNIQEPTCEGLGKSESVCAVCEDKKEKEIKAIGHSYGSWAVTVEATCTADGSKEKSCSRCDGKISEAIKSTGHSLSVWVTSKQATCTEDGSKKQTCSKCDYTNTETIKATGHDMSDATCTKAKTCRKCGATEGNALGHNNVNGYCSRCGDKIEIDMNTVVGNPNDCKTTSYFGFCYYKNSADGIKVCWGGENLSGKTINYYTVTIYFYNSVGDPAYSEITGKSSKTIKYVGPVQPNKDLIIYGIVDYVPVCSKVVIGEITLEYSDGTSDTGWYGWSTTYKNSAIK